MGDSRCGSVRSSVTARSEASELKDPRHDLLADILPRAEAIDVRQFAYRGLASLEGKASFFVAQTPVYIQLKFDPGTEFQKAPGIRVNVKEGGKERSILLESGIQADAASIKLRGISAIALRVAANELFAQLDATRPPTAVVRAPASQFDDGKAV